MSLQKITIEPGSLKGRAFTKSADLATVTAQYNPKEFTIETRNQYQRTTIPGLPTPITQRN